MAEERTGGRGHAIGIGGQKCGSSWIFDLLRLNDRVSVPRIKEVDYFSHHYDRGHDWYRHRFPAPGLCFEASPSYLSDPRAPARARVFSPEMKIVVSLRDPVERAFSHHLHEIAKGHIPARGFAQALADNPEYLSQGCYGRHLSRWFDQFPAEQILVLFAEEVFADPDAARTRLAGFLQIAPGPALTERRNVSDRPRSGAARAVLRGGGDALRRMGQERALIWLKRQPLVRDLLRWNSQSLRDVVPPLTDAERAHLAGLFSEDMRELRQLTGRSSLPWASAAGLEAAAPRRANGSAGRRH